MSGETAVKVCAGPCSRELPRSEFYRNRGTADGYQGTCKACHEAKKRREERAKPRGYQIVYAVALDSNELPERMG